MNVTSSPIIGDQRAAALGLASYCFIVGVVSLTLNALVLDALRFARIARSTTSLLAIQCIGDTLGSIPLIVYTPWVTVAPSLPVPFGAERFFAFLFLVQVYLFIPAQVCMAANRFIFILLPFKADRLLHDHGGYIGMLVYCVAWAIAWPTANIFPCCALTYIRTTGEWSYAGATAVAQFVTPLSSVSYASLCFSCACCAAVIVKLVRRRNQIQPEENLEEKGKRKLEKSIFFQQLSMSIVWLFNILALYFYTSVPPPYRMIYGSVTESIRYVGYFAHPLMSIYFIRAIRENVAKRVKPLVNVWKRAVSGGAPVVGHPIPEIILLDDVAGPSRPPRSGSSFGWKRWGNKSIATIAPRHHSTERASYVVGEVAT